MFRQHVFYSELASKCRFCGCPVVDDCVSLSTVDAAKLSNWSVARTGVPIAEESAGASWSCMNCVREAKRCCEMNPLEEDCIWWDEIKDRYFNYYKRGWMKSCSVAVARLPEDQVIRLLDCSHQNVKKQKVKEEVEEENEDKMEEEQEVEVEEQDRKVKAETLGDSMEVDSNLSSAGRVIPNGIKLQSSVMSVYARKTCSLCHMSPIKSFKNHITRVICILCKRYFPCKGLLSSHEVDCFKKCPLCPKRVTTNYLLDRHLNASHKTKDGFWQHNKLVPFPHFCNWCNVGLETKYHFLKHTKACKVRYVCDTCGAKYQMRYNFLCHLHKEHQLQLDVVLNCCNKCNTIFLTEKSLRKHQTNSLCSSNRTTAVLVACKFCGNNFVDGVLQRHMPQCQLKKEAATKRKEIEVQVQTNLSDKYIAICHFCGKRNFQAMNRVWKHLYEHHKKGVLPEQCVCCKVNIKSLAIRRTHYCPTRPKVACSKCNLKMYEEYLFRHQVIYKCCKCFVSFPCEYLFRQHLTERTFPCLICGRAYCDISSLTDHTHSKHGKGVEVGLSWTGLEHSHLGYTKCFPCKTYFGSSDELRKHKRMYHKKYHCELCPQMFVTKSALNPHFFKRHFPETFFNSRGLHNMLAELKESGINVFERLKEFESETTVCSRSTSSDQTTSTSENRHKSFPTTTLSLTKHKQSCAKSPERFVCEKCNQVYLSKNGLVRHFSKTHAYRWLKELACSMCDATFFSRTLLATHMKETHLRTKIEYSFTCSVCTWATDKRTVLANHLLIKHDMGRFDNICPHCKYYFSKQGRKAHSCANRPKVKCSHCNHTMFEEYFLEHALEETCTNCKETYPCEISFIRHARERFFPCSECVRFFCNMEALTQHAAEDHNLKVMDVPWEGAHNSVNNIRCLDCRQYFYDNLLLQKHNDRFHGEEVCTMCALWMPSNSSQQMEEHIKVKHTLIFPSYKKLNQIVPDKSRFIDFNPSVEAAEVCSNQSSQQPVELIFIEVTGAQEKNNFSVCVETEEAVHVTF